MKIVVLAGGISTERDVSLMSGSRIYKALKENGHQAILLDVFLGYDNDPDQVFSLDIDWAEKVAPVREEEPDISEVKKNRKDQSNMLFGPNVIRICKDADIVFMALHGDCGENGKIQATFDLFDIKYTGTDSLSSALAMDKFLTKKMFQTHGVKGIAFRHVKAILCMERDHEFLVVDPYSRHAAGAYEVVAILISGCLILLR